MDLPYQKITRIVRKLIYTGHKFTYPEDSEILTRVGVKRGTHKNM